jgi:hypothetical protein
MSKQATCTPFVTGLDTAWWQDPVVLGIQPIVAGALIPYRPDQREILQKELNTSGPINWKIRSITYFPQTDKVVNALYLHCEYYGQHRGKCKQCKQSKATESPPCTHKKKRGKQTPSIPWVGTGQRSRTSKKTQCKSGINFQWLTPDATVCTVTKANYEHVGHAHRSMAETSAADFPPLDASLRDALVNTFVSLPTNPSRKDAMAMAATLAGRYVPLKAVDHMLQLATTLRDKRLDGEAQDLVSQNSELLGLALSAKDVTIRGKGGASAALLACLKSKAVSTGLRFVCEFGSATIDHLLGYTASTCAHVHVSTMTIPPHIHRPCKIPALQAHILARQSPGIFHGSVMHSYVTDAICFAGRAGEDHHFGDMASPAFASPLTEPAEQTEEAFDPRVHYDHANHCYTDTATRERLPSSTLLASLATPNSSQHRFNNQDTVHVRNGHVRQQAWRLIVQGKPLTKHMRAKLASDQAFLNIQKHIQDVDRTKISFLPTQQRMLCVCGAGEGRSISVGVTGEAPFVHVESGEAGGFEWKSGNKPSGIKALQVTTHARPHVHTQQHTSTRPHVHHHTGLDSVQL